MKQTKKKFFKQCFSRKGALGLLITAMAIIVAGCKTDLSEVWDSIDGLKERVTKVEKECNALNSNIKAVRQLVEAQKANVSITSITPYILEGKKAGYTIHLTEGEPIVILNGKDGINGKDGLNGKNGINGKDGLNGKDGATPEIGVRKDVDGIYYWTLNGEWLLNDQQQKMRVTGKDGAKGEKGDPGKDGITPQLKIENENWLVSTDHGASWEVIGSAVGPKVEPGKNTFIAVDTSDPEVVVFTLTNGDKISLMRSVGIINDLSTNSLDFNNEKGTLSFSFTSMKLWTAQVAENQSGEEWCTLGIKNGASGSFEIPVSVTQNLSPEERKVSILLKSGDETKVIVVTQKQKDALTLTTNNFEVAQEGGQITIEVKANVNYTAAISEESKSWIREVNTRAMQTTRKSYTIDANEGDSPRVGTIVISSGEINEVVTVRQAAKSSILLSTETMEVSSESQTIDVVVRSNIEFKAEAPSASWVKPLSTRSLSSHTLRYTVDANETTDMREATIVFKQVNGNASATLHIRQLQKNVLKLAKRSIVVEKEGGIVNVELNENTNGYEVVIPQNAGWVTQNPATRALATHQLSFRVAPNSGDKVRTALIIIKGHAHGLNETLNIVQKGQKESGLVVGTAGSLKQTVEESLTGSMPENLVISGVINGDDINYIHQYANRIRTIDLSQAKIVNGSDYNGQNTVESVVSYAMFANMQKLESIILPEGIKEIGERAFFNCQKLVNVVLPSTMEKIGYEAFKSCNSLTDIQLPNSMIGIGQYAFEDCTSLTSIKNPNSLEWIGKYAFKGCSSLTSIVIPNGVGTIQTATFDGCTSLTSIKLPNSVRWIESQAFNNCSSLTSIEIPNSVRRIEYHAFNGCSSLTSIVIPNGVRDIEESTFYGCSSLKSIKIPNSVKSFGKQAFEGCSSLTSIVIPNLVTKIENNTFVGCTSLKSIKIPNSVTSIGVQAFKGCSSLKSVEIPNSVTSIGGDHFYGGAFEDCTSLMSIEIPNSITSIESKAFKNCTSLTSIKIPNSVTSIGYDAFKGCTSLKSIELPNSVTDITIAAFEGCSSLKSIEIPYGVKLIADFKGCTSLKSIKIPNTVTMINPNTFEGCTSLKSIEIPKSVTSIRNAAFKGCNFEKVTCYGVKPPQLDQYQDNAKIDTLYVPKGSKGAYESYNPGWRRRFHINKIVEMN